MPSRPNTTSGYLFTMVIGLVIAVCAALAIALFASPSTAFAKSYTMPKVNIQAEVLADGSLHVVEQRDFDFSGNFTAVWWEMGALPPAATVTFNSVRMGVWSDDQAPAQFNEVEEVPFQTLWRTEGGPGTTAYSVDASQDTCYLFFNVSDARMTAEVDYTITNAVTPYADCAELYWKFVGDGWQEASHDVTCTVSLPVPEDTTPVPGETVRAWGHGLLSGEVSFSDNATKVDYTIDYVGSGDFAEARVIFPVEWLTEANPAMVEQYGTTDHLQEVLDEEAYWANESNRQRTRSLVIVLSCAMAALALIIWGFIMFFRHGREHKPAFADEYWRDEPDPGVHPVVISRLWSFGKERNTDFTVAIMNLANQGALRIDKGSYEAPTRFGGTRHVDDYYITRNPNYQASDSIDREVMDLLFNKIANSKDQLWLSEIGIWGKAHPQQFVKAMESFQSKVTTAVANRNYFEETGDRMRGTTALVATLALGAGIGISMWMDNFIPVIALGIAAAVLYILAVFMPRRSLDGVDVYARCEALRHWLTDFSLLNERPTTDVKVWGQFMVFAYIFGVADKVMKELRDTMPQVFQKQDAMVSAGDMYSPWYTMYNIDGISRQASFSVALDNTLVVVGEAISAAASSSGGGGGFSGGGGGGFGGGGGGGAR